MKRFSLVVVLICALLVSSRPAVADAAAQLRDVTANLLLDIQMFYPVNATYLGLSGQDGLLADYSSRSTKAFDKKLRDGLRRLERIDTTQLSTADLIDFRLIRSNARIIRQQLNDIEWHRKSPVLYADEVVNGLYSLTATAGDSLSPRVIPILSRMRAVPGFFATAKKNLRKPPPVLIEVAREQLTAADRFYKTIGAQLMNELPDRANEILRVSTLAREAITSFDVWLETVEPGDSGSFSIGREELDYILREEYFLPYGADSLLAIGEALLADAQAAYSAYEAELAASPSTTDSVFVPQSFTRDDLLDYYQWEVEQVRVWLTDNDILTVPEDIAPVRVVETPDFLRPMIAGIAYLPAAPFSEEQMGIFYVRPVPEELSDAALAGRYRYVHRRGFKGSVVHEAYPGHHLQSQIAGRHPEAIRKWQQNMMLMEGWALFSEEMTYRNGLFGESDPGQWLGVLGGIRFRAARIVADVKLHTGAFTYPECVAWMIDVLEADSKSAQDYLTRSVRKYTFTPGRWMSYLMGKREVERLQRAARVAWGAEYSDRVFFDRLLAEGSIPPALMWEALGLSRLDADQGLASPR